MEEIWKDIEEYEGIYQISSHGRVKSLKRIVVGPSHIGGEIKIKGRIRKNHLRKDSYMGISLNKEGHCNSFLIHRLVANAFILNSENKPDINHKNGVKTDNRVENLEWCTSTENLKHAYRIGLKKANKNLLGKYGATHPTSKDIIQYDLSGNLIAKYGSAHEASRITKINRGSICQCARGEYLTAGGYIWKWR